MEVCITNSCLFGIITEEDKNFDVCDIFTAEEILNYKIIKLRIYLGYLKGKKVILGIGITFKNLLNGKLVNTVHKGDSKVEEIEELIIKDNDYLTNVFINIINK